MPPLRYAREPRLTPSERLTLDSKKELALKAIKKQIVPEKEDLIRLFSLEADDIIKKREALDEAIQKGDNTNGREGVPLRNLITAKTLASVLTEIYLGFLDLERRAKTTDSEKDRKRIVEDYFKLKQSLIDKQVPLALRFRRNAWSEADWGKQDPRNRDMKEPKYSRHIPLTKQRSAVDTLERNIEKRTSNTTQQTTSRIRVATTVVDPRNKNYERHPKRVTLSARELDEFERPRQLTGERTELDIRTPETLVRSIEDESPNKIRAERALNDFFRTNHGLSNSIQTLRTIFINFVRRCDTIPIAANLVTLFIEHVTFKTKFDFNAGTQTLERMQEIIANIPSNLRNDYFSAALMEKFDAEFERRKPRAITR